MENKTKITALGVVKGVGLMLTTPEVAGPLALIGLSAVAISAVGALAVNLAVNSTLDIILGKKK